MGLFGILARRYKVLITLLVLLLSVGYVHKLCVTHKGEDAFEYGYYDYENQEEGKMRWMWRKGGMRVEAMSNLFWIKVVAQPHNSKGPDGLEFKIFLDDEILDSIHFFNGGSRNLYYYIPNLEGKDVEIRTEVDKTFNPLRLKINEDGRELGVAVSPVTFLKIMPKDGVGFYHWETWGSGKVPGWPEGMPVRSRWTGMRASMLPTDYPSTIVPAYGAVPTRQPSLTLFLMCAHPDIDKNPVVLKILSDGALLKQETFANHQWKKVLIEPEVLNYPQILTFQVNRTWNPKLAGVSEDGRDLGVAIAVLKYDYTHK